MSAEPGPVGGIIEGIRRSTYEVQTELRLAEAGLKEEQDVAGVLERYAWLYDPETVRRARQAHRDEHEPERKERLRRVYYYLTPSDTLSRNTGSMRHADPATKLAISRY